MSEDHVVLKHLNEFKSVLADYQLSADSKRLLKKLNLVLLSAPTAAGRNTIIDELQKTAEYYFIVSDTTRPPKVRDGKLEVNGERYFFRNEEDLLSDLKAGKFLEAEVIHDQQVSGISMRELSAALDADKIAITDVDIGGVHNVLEHKPDAVCIMILPPSFDEWQRRIKFREDMPEAEHRRRLATALNILKTALELDYFQYVINNELMQAALDVDAIARMGNIDPERQADGKRLAEQLLIETRVFLDAK